MTSRRHYVKQHNAILHNAPARLTRGDNVPDENLTPEQLEFRRKLQAMRARIKYIDQDSLARDRKPLQHGPMCDCSRCTSCF